MLFKNDHFIIKYTESDVGYIDRAIERLNNKYDEYMEFLELENYQRKLNLFFIMI